MVRWDVERSPMRALRGREMGISHDGTIYNVIQVSFLLRYGGTRTQNGLSSLWHFPHQIVRRGCHIHAVPAT